MKLLGYLDGGLSDVHQNLIREHLASCKDCAHYVRETEMFEARLTAAAARRARGIFLSSQVSTRVQERVYRRMRRAFIMQRVTRYAGVVVAAAAAVVLVAGLFSLWQTGLLEMEKPGNQDVPLFGQDAPTIVTFACPDHQLGEFEPLARKFEETNPDIRVQFISTDAASGQRHEGSTVTSDGQEVQRLTAAVDAFIWYAHLQPDDWAFVLDLSPFVDGSSFPAGDFFPGTLDAFRWQGRLYGIPARISPYLIFFDKTMFDAAGVSYPHIGWTWDEFTDATARLTLREGDEIERYGFVDVWFYNTLRAMIHQYGVSLWDDRTNPAQPLFDTPELADVMHRYINLAVRDEIMPVPELGSNLSASNLINEGKAAIWTDAAYNRGYHGRRTQLGLAPFPEAVNAANPTSMYGFFISAGTLHPEATWRWLSYLSAHDQPPFEGSVPGRRSATERLPWWRELDEQTKAVIEYALDHPSPPDSPLDRPLTLAVNAMLQDGTDAAAALALAQAKALEIQAAMDKAKPGKPQAVATPRPLAGEEQTVIAFAPASGSDLTTYRNLAVAFREARPDIWVNIAPWTSDVSELAGSCDCFAGSMTLVSVPALRQSVRSLRPLATADASFDLSDFYPQFLAPLEFDGELWALPYTADAQMVYMNSYLFEEAAVAPPKPDWDFEEFLDLAVTFSNNGQFGFTVRGGAYRDLRFALEGLGAQLLDRVGDSLTITLDDPTVVSALEQYADLSRGRELTPATPSIQTGWPAGTILGGHPFGVETGDVAMWIDWISYHDFAPSPLFEAWVTVLPEESRANAALDVKAYYISKYADEPQACWDWITFLSSQAEIVELLPARRSVAQSPAYREQVSDAALQAYQSTLETITMSSGEKSQFVSEMEYAAPWLYAAFQETVAGGRAENALAEAQTKAKAFMDCLELAGGPYGTDKLLDCARHVDPEYPVQDAIP